MTEKSTESLSFSQACTHKLRSCKSTAQNLLQDFPFECLDTNCTYIATNYVKIYHSPKNLEISVHCTQSLHKALLPFIPFTYLNNLCPKPWAYGSHLPSPFIYVRPTFKSNFFPLHILCLPLDVARWCTNHTAQLVLKGSQHAWILHQLGSNLSGIGRTL